MRWCIVVAALVLVACGTGGFTFHGQYCGPGVPKNGETPEVQDDLDAVCKAHDDCYSQFPSQRHRCDLKIVRELIELKLNPQCSETAREMALYFAGLHPSSARGDPSVMPLALAGKANVWPLTAAGLLERGASVLADGRARKQSICCDRRSLAAPGSPCYPQSSTLLRLRLSEMLTRWSDIQELYYEKEIPQNILRYARHLARVPHTEQVIAIAYSPGAVIIFTESGMFLGRIIGRESYYTYNAISAIQIRVIDQHTLAIGREHFRITDWPIHALRDIIVSVGSVANVTPTIQNSPDVSSTEIAPFVGTWRGIVSQRGAKPYLVILRIDQAIHPYKGAAVGTIEYPKPNCGGTISLIETSSNAMKVAEVLSFGQRRCVSGGTVLLELATTGAVSWFWTDGHRYQASATLKRDQ